MLRRVLLCLFCAAALLLGGCRDWFEAEVVVETDYEPPRPAAESEDTAASVKSLEDIKELILNMVAEGEGQRSFVFDPAYPGDLSTDLSTACWQVRTQDALCAYCVENIAYDVSRVRNSYEGSVSVSYSEAAGDVESIVQLPFAVDAQEPLCGAMRSGQKRLVLLIEHSSYSEEGMEQLVRQLYLETPSLSPREPSVTVVMFTGADTQRLYELSFDYGLSDGELDAQKAALAALDPFDGIELSGLSEAERAMLACSWLCVHTSLSEPAGASSIYDALITGEADSLGLACAYVELCRGIGLECRIVSGQRNWEEHSWNLVRLDGDWYHVDTAACETQGLVKGFLMNDERAWERYRWDYFSYPHCEGALRFEDVDAAWQTGSAK